MDSALKTALQSPNPTTCTLVEIELPEATLRLTNGGFVIWGSNAFISADAAYGSLDSVDTVSDGTEAQTSAARVVLLPYEDAALATLAHPDAQRSPIRIWQGAVNQSTGALIGEPEPLFIGILDYVTVSVSEDSREAIIEAITEASLQTETNAERRLNHAFHQSCWPGELGLAYVTGIERRKVYWRVESPRGAVQYGGGGAGSGGGGFGGGGGFDNVSRI